MKNICLVFIFLIGSICFSQTLDFPKSWEGNWKGDLKIYNSGSSNPTTTIPMKLIIQPKNDSIWSWEIHYLTEKQDIRKYELVKVGKTNSWHIDEKNGIILPQTFMVDKMTSSFSFEKTLLIASYELKNDQMHFEIIVTETTSNSITGEGSDDSPSIGIHKISSFHRAILTKE